MNIILKNTENEKSANYNPETKGFYWGEMSYAISIYKDIEDLVEAPLPVELGIQADDVVPIRFNQEQIVTALANLEEKGAHKGPGSLYRALKKIQIKGMQNAG